MDATWTGPTFRLFDPAECKALISELDEKLSVVVDSSTGDPDRLRVRNSELSELVKSKLTGVSYYVGGDFTLSPLWFYTRYGPGAGLSPHYDGQFKCDDQTSVATLLVYLNDDFEGGETAFLDDDENVLSEVVPVAGRALVLKQDVYHMAAAVTKGVKYLLRTDVMRRN
jgi:predicted 2-oxoglutarate/Fe(II)-dependent dioxygenase YbiX